MKLNQLLQEFSKRNKIEPLFLDDEGISRTVINDRHLITFEQFEEGFYLYSAIGPLPVGQEEELGLEALSGNLFGRETGKSHLGYVEATRSLVLYHYFDEIPEDYTVFEQQFQEFINFLVYWTEKIELTAEHSIDVLSLKRHVNRLENHQNLKIFFA